ncbi:MAG: pyruvate ferredoxin oxidoreductase [Thermoplasmata archaeon]|nr:MAG: pyruvate ferredoxin oxidoreductase [Thermoplasmata archaeon]
MTRMEILFGGFGGQGIVRAGLITAKALSLYEDRMTTFTQAYGPEARGGASSACVVVDDEGVDYPYVTRADILVVLSQEAYKKYIGMLKNGGVLIYEKNLVSIDEADIPKGAKVYSIPATKIAEELGNKIAANIVTLGYLTRITKIVKYESMKKAVKESVPKRFIELNMKALEAGYNYKEGSA